MILNLRELRAIGRAPSIGAVVVALSAGSVAAQLARDPVLSADLRHVAVLPDTIDTVLAVDNLSRIRQSASGRALEKFLAETSTWDRSAAAWADLSRAIDLSDEQAVDDLLGRGILFAARSIGGDAQHALLSRISPQTEARLRGLLRPAPRALVDGQPILALENGAFELSTALPRVASDDARLLVAPRGSTGLFDELLPVLSGGTAISTLSMTPAWKDVRALGAGDVFLLMRSNVDQQSGEDDGFFCLRADFEPRGFGARILATDSMLLADLTPPPGPASPAWPVQAVDALEQNALLCIAGSPVRGPARTPLFGTGDSERTLLLGLLAKMDLPPDLEGLIDGVAIVAVHADADRPAAALTAQGLSVTVAVPTADIARFATVADRWALGIAEGVPADDLVLDGMDSLAPDAGVRAASIPAANPELMNGYLQAGGAVAWTFVTAAPGRGSDRGAGWWVINLRTGPDDAAKSAAKVRETAGLLALPAPASDQTVFRLVVRPSLLAGLVGGGVRENSDGPIFADAGPLRTTAVRPVARRQTDERSALHALRWLDLVESRLTRTPRGLIEGAVSVRFDLNLLSGE